MGHMMCPSGLARIFHLLVLLMTVMQQGNTIDVNLMPRPILRIRWVIPALQVLEKHVVVEKA